MKLTPELEAAFNTQITLEFQASVVYRQLVIEMELADLPGVEHV
jgi:ferritin